MARSSTLGIPLTTFSVHDFSGGLDIKTEPIKLADRGNKNKWLLIATNVVYNVDGSVAKRWGMRVVNSSSTLNVSQRLVNGGIQFRKGVGTVYDVVATTSGKAYTLNTDGTVTEIATGMTAQSPLSISSFVQYNDAILLARTAGVPQTWDGTTWAALGGSSPATAKVFAVHGNRIFATDNTIPSRMYWSKLNNALDWSGTTDAGFMDVSPNDGGIVRTLVPSAQELVILKDQRPYRLQGIGPATGFNVADNLVPSRGSKGTYSQRGGIFAVNDVWYTSDMGMHRLSATQDFGDLQEAFISKPVEPIFRANTPYTTVLGPTQIESNPLLYEPSLHYDEGSSLIFARLYGVTSDPAGGSPGASTLAYDPVPNAWSVWDIGYKTNNILAMWPARNRTTGAAETWFSVLSQATGSVIGAWDRTSLSDLDTNVDPPTTQAIAARIRHVTNLGQSDMEKTPRRLFLYFKKESSTTTITLNLYADFKTTAVFTTTFDITSSTAETQVVKRIDLGGFTCEYLEVDIQQATVAKGFTFYGYEVQYRDRRRIRRAE